MLFSREFSSNILSSRNLQVSSYEYITAFLYEVYPLTLLTLNNVYFYFKIIAN